MAAITPPEHPNKDSDNSSDNQKISIDLLKRDALDLQRQFEVISHPAATGSAELVQPIAIRLPPKWRDRMIDLTREYPEPEFIFEFEGKKFFTKGDVVTIKGKPKKGKSHLMIAFIIALLSGEFIGMQRLQRVSKILYIDAEMHANYTASLNRKILHSAGLSTKVNTQELIVLNMKADTPAERERLIEEAIQELQPDIVFIDGVKDITRTEHNDPAEGKRIGEELKQWSAKYNCLIAIAIHENKNDMNSRGAVGASVEEISSEVWRIDRDIEGVFTASQMLFRYHSPVENLCFTMDGLGNIHREEARPKEDPAVKKRDKVVFLFKKVFKDRKSLKYTDLIAEYRVIEKCAQTTAYNNFKKALSMNVIYENAIGNYEFNNLTSPHI